ncbi:L,D-transpeptidase family protein [Plastoroseomonas arctica]|uniref:L,D-transpeptidase family protein n=1 Tax=Plastoroseomonas arctica TaxID=1509237 RepID=A0AAF1K7V1_9PROT|nr:L,D-transpeptidase family protein [Plastoroseomonas arctica]MBR0657246.1 L,D-transpeptidase family protein [Plastoroseomonas arctica]
MTSARVTPEGRVTFEDASFRCALGAAGIRAVKQEGDEATPAGLLPIRRLLYRADRIAPPDGRLPRAPLAPEDGWCDDPFHADYNRQVTLPHPARHEHLWREDALYDLIGVLGWNDTPVVRHRGSAIFLHIARPDYAPTAGCVALSRPDLRRLLAMGASSLEIVA